MGTLSRGEEEKTHKPEYTVYLEMTLIVQEKEGGYLILMLQILHFGFAFLHLDPKILVTLMTVRHKSNKVC